VYCGVFKLNAAFDGLRRLLPADPKSFDDRPVAGDGALFALVLSDDGQPMLGSEVLSGCAWAMGRAISPGPGVAGWLDGLEDAEAALAEMLEDLAGEPGEDPAGEPDGGGPAHAISIDDLLERVEELAELLGVQQLQAGGIRVQSRAVSTKRADRPDDHDFLNSFIAEDLAMVAGEVRDGNLGCALRSYLSFDDEIDTGARVDVNTQLDVVHAAVAPDRVPLGRWPAKAEHPLGLSQQLAVASAMRSLGDSAGIFAVNGPPGTGKTTMLREVIADIVVQRALRLAELDDPHEAFTGEHTWKSGGWPRTVQEFKAELTGFEMVVACTTNAAAENISIEIPGIDAIDPDRSSEIDYFPQLAARLLNAKRRADAGSDVAAWAMVAGCLGSMDNRLRFARTLWFDAKAPTPPPHANHPLPPPPSVRLGLQAILKSYEQPMAPGPPWAASVAEFQAVLDRARELADERSRAFELLDIAEAVEADAERLGRQAASAPGELAEARRRHADQQAIAAACREDCDQGVQARRDHREFRPRLRDSLTSTGRATAREWHARDRELADTIDGGQTEAQAAERLAGTLAEDAEAAERHLRELQTAAASADQRVRDLHADLARARERFASFVPDPGWWEDRARREREAPWIDAPWNAARTDLFLAALRLHKAFVIATAKKMRQSLHGAIDILDGSAPADLPADAALAAWRSLFFLVPVLSTSFASFARVFSHVGRESLGWLFIDEAGQCTAQAPAGAIWRSRRVVVVGDPLQLEPVVTLPFTAQQAIRREHGVDETWLPSRASAQTLSDRVSPIGTWRGSGSDAMWVGAPLNVHRRCDEPIFAIVNAIAYDGQMINATPIRADLALPPSKWLDIASTHSDGHWIPARESG
jgi:hypothetical protein